MSAVLCFMMVPTAMGDNQADLSGSRALFETFADRALESCRRLRSMRSLRSQSVVLGAIGVTFAGYRSQMRAALAPSARVAGSAWLRRRLAA